MSGLATTETGDTAEPTSAFMKSGQQGSAELARKFSSVNGTKLPIHRQMGLKDQETSQTAHRRASCADNVAATLTCSGSCECSPSSGASSGTISDGPGDYSSNQNCEWVISGTAVSITFTEFFTESNFDYVTVNQCGDSSCSSPVRLARLSGSEGADQTYSTTTGILQVIFTSDGRVEYWGFVAQWNTNLPGCGTECPENSDTPSGSVTCLCNPGYTGPDDGTCQACGVGTYKDSPGSRACTSCSAGTCSWPRFLCLPCA